MADDLDLDLDSPGGSGGAGAGGSSGGGGGGGMDLGIIIGLIMGFGSLIAGMVIEHASIIKYTPLLASMGGAGPSAFIIVVGGTIGATMTSVGLPTFKRMPLTFMRALRYQSLDRVGAIKTLVGFAEKARREGLLVLEDDLQKANDEFLRKGVQLVVDGTDPELVKEILQTEVDSMAEEHERDAGTWMAMGGYSPTLGIIGTVMALVVVLSNLSDAASLGPSISLAFIATFYGVSLANLVYMPIGTKLGLCSKDELASHELMIEGILAIQSGDNPRIVEEKLVAFLDSGSKLAFLQERSRRDEFDLAA